MSRRAFLRVTPAMHIDGAKYEGYCPLKELQEIVEQRMMLNKAKQ